ncbi:MAG: hypothetical protein N3G19_03830, partial [Candidatus Pacearchaeota archaeon]|nr:hypothetical protein [Candidatus Pacearchaeota archaeon]
MPIFRKGKKEEKLVAPVAPRAPGATPQAAQIEHPYPEVEAIKESAKPIAEAELPKLPELPELPEPETEELPMPEAMEEETEIKSKLPKKLTQEIGPVRTVPTVKQPVVTAGGPAIPPTTPAGLPRTGAGVEAVVEKPLKPRPVFIKIDKFKEITASVDSIEKDVQEIAGVIKRLK